ncbi:helix-turn-helix domain-containing protein [Brevibacterium sp. SMBL_HHYL_HB1]|jgi:hypothetical protein|uniref:helix-turn-helix domain-containing protein n=1 Tax=Brevibacterium sp. SMBL_HHYL_HB1 TaxID=2777556 RepID=UPI001BA7F931|nr:helix-turn-helix domain-containing protein [Brevibacterium sp. SMBL_HHYL_HB1]QUL78074.1 helix-turn-helix domain-containing protein [Brevibacterium sp. SMBL_HHYL_HB1]
MAVEMITWARRQVFEQFKLSGPERFILMLLADNASFDEETGLWSAFPLQNTLAQESGFNERTVQRALKRFRDFGLLSTETRYKKSGAKSGNMYRLHPEAVAEPIARNEAIPGFSSDDTQSGPENSSDDTESGTPVQAREFKTRHTVGYPEEDDPTRHTVGYYPTQSRVPRAETTAGASLTVIEPSSSSMSSSATTDDGVPSAGAEADETTTRLFGDEENGSSRDRLGTHPVSNARIPVDLDKLVEVVAGQWSVTVDRDRAAWLAEQITARSARAVGSPDAFVRRSLVNDGHEWEAAVIDHFGDRRSWVRSPGHSSVDDRKCPIKHHADSGWSARSCPGCRKHLDFPKQLDRATYEALEADVRSLVDRDQTVTVVDMTRPSVRSRDRSGRTVDRDAG